MFAAPEHVVSGWQEGWNNKNAKALAALFTEDADFVNVVGLWWHNRDDIEEAHRYGFEKIFTDSHIIMGKPRIREFQDAAVVQTRWRMTEQTALDGEKPLPRKGIFTFVCQKFPEGWLAVTGHNSDIISGAETHIQTVEGITAVNYRKSG